MSFLSDVADHLLKNHKDHLGECTIIFPNRRAGLFLKKELAKKLDSPIWSPATLSLEDFLFSFTEIKKADPLTLIFELYESFLAQHGQNTAQEGFDSFYHWGEMLLRDFEEVDHYLMDPKQVFTLVKDDRQLSESFYFLDDEQEKIIQKFWKEFFPTSTKTQQKFIETWEILLPVYRTFKERLQAKQIGYTAHIYRDLVDNLDKITCKTKQLIFAGFNALTPSEEALIKHFILEYQAEIHWDVDAYYLTDSNQEAGNFLRNYQKDLAFISTFPASIDDRISLSKSIESIGVSLEIGQTKLVSEGIASLVDEGVRPDEIVLVLPQDYMLFPVLNAIPDTVEQLNVTMGYPLKETPLFGLLEACIELQEHASFSEKNGLSFYHKPTLDILCHPLLYKEDKSPIDKLISDIQRKNQIRIFQDEVLAINSTMLNVIFRKVEENENAILYLKEITSVLSSQVVERFGLEGEYLYHFQQLLDKLENILQKQHALLNLKTLKSLFRKVAASIKMPFSGEPVEGLQVMGVLETRNLDFNYVFMLNMNEGSFPATQRQGSFIPYRIRKAFHLPTYEVQESIYAYLFYRLFHNSKNLTFYHNTYADFGLSGEVSRFIRQIELESGLQIVRKNLSNSVQVNESKPITIASTKGVVEKLLIYTDKVPAKEQRRLSASALNTYLECKLRFYFRYVLRLFTNDEMSEDLDARHFGNALHRTMEYLYLDTMDEKGSRIIDFNDFFRLENSIDGAIEKAFKKEFGLNDKKRFEFKDRNIVMADVIRKFVSKVLSLDKGYVPFEIISLEDEDKYERFLQIDLGGEEIGVKLGADIDRVDKKEGKVRVLDYKTGRDETNVGEFSNIFKESVHYKYKYSRKAGYQTFFYAWLYASKRGEELPIEPGLINLKKVFQTDFDHRLQIDGQYLSDVRSYLPEFEEKLKFLLEEIFNENIPFDQTEDDSKCKFCDFKSICDRA